MQAPGLSVDAVSPKALAAFKSSGIRRSYWDWGEMLAMNKTGYFPYTPATDLLFGLDVAIDMLPAEGLENVFARHARMARLHAGPSRPGVWRTYVARRAISRRSLRLGWLRSGCGRNFSLTKKSP
jgi:hypothetical protein